MHADFFFPIQPHAALYFMGDEVDDTSPARIYSRRGEAFIQVFAESSVDVHLRNAFILHSYPEHIYFYCLSSITMSVLSYEGLKFGGSRRDYTPLQQLCRRKYLKETVTRTLTFKGDVILADLTDEVHVMGNNPVAHGSYSDVWKGEWYDPTEQRTRVVRMWLSPSTTHPDRFVF